MTRVLILDGSIHPESYRPSASWRRLLRGRPADAVHLPSGEAVPDLAAYTHLILTGSEASIVRPEPWFAAEAGALAAALDRGLSVLGSCFGHQMLALTISGPAHVRRAAVPEIGWIALELLGPDPLLAGLPGRLHCFSSHFDEVCDPPPPWRVLARSAGCAVQAMRWGDRPVWGLQAHPEIAPEEARMLLAEGAAGEEGRAGWFRRALAEETRDDRVAQALMDAFLAGGAGRP